MTNTINAPQISDKRLLINTDKTPEIIELGEIIIGLDRVYRSLALIDLITYKFDDLNIINEKFLSQEFRSVFVTEQIKIVELHDFLIFRLNYFLPDDYLQHFDRQVYYLASFICESSNFSRANILENFNELIVDPIYRLIFLRTLTLNTRSPLYSSGLIRSRLNLTSDTVLFSSAITDKNFIALSNYIGGTLRINRIAFQSPGSLDLLGLGKILETIKDLIITVVSEERWTKNQRRLKEQILEEELLQKRLNNAALRIENINRYIDLKRKSKNASLEIDYLIGEMNDGLSKIKQNFDKVNQVQVIEGDE